MAVRPGKLGQALRDLPFPALPKDLLFQVRMSLSHERARRERPSWLWRLRNQWGHMALPGAAGLLSAVVLFSLLGTHFDVPLLAASEDVPDVATLRSGGAVFDRTVASGMVGRSVRSS